MSCDRLDWFERDFVLARASINRADRKDEDDLNSSIFASAV